jgi:hypothetical protein
MYGKTFKEGSGFSDKPTGCGPIGPVFTRKSGTATKAPSRLSLNTESRNSRAAWCSDALL